MSFAIGIYDLFTYALPGALQLSFLVYVLVRLKLVEFSALTSLPSVVLVVAVVVVSFVLGHICNPISLQLERLIPGRRRNFGDAQRNLGEDVPAARGRAFLKADQRILRSAIELHDRDAAAEIGRFQATGLMLRNLVLPFTSGLLAAIVEVCTGPRRLLAVYCVVLFVVGVLAAVREGRKQTHWERMRTLEVAFWVPNIDDKLAEAEE
ncbi:hypothetical protein ACGFMK_40960 [Amycolatopsis sp. NPDC049252]|uniref:hypothetical protein n=1 Tax=Amycolatopsis sp. NPDC049252 TaxID=3363933 RepID=UPI00371CF118